MPNAEVRINILVKWSRVFLNGVESSPTIKRSSGRLPMGGMVLSNTIMGRSFSGSSTVNSPSERFDQSWPSGIAPP
ncbi:hypothetical protein D3C75_1218170 [compost metagenome]